MMQPIEIQSIETEAVRYPFTPRELERLAMYRAAAAAGFYTDWSEDAKASNRSALVSARAASPAASPIEHQPSGCTSSASAPR